MRHSNKQNLKLEKLHRYIEVFEKIKLEQTNLPDRGICLHISYITDSETERKEVKKVLLKYKPSIFRPKTYTFYFHPDYTNGAYWWEDYSSERKRFVEFVLRDLKTKLQKLLLKPFLDDVD